VQGIINDGRRMTVVEHLAELRSVLLLDVLERPITSVLGHGRHLATAPIVTSVTSRSPSR
jgi:hypothetical protein